MMNLLRKSIFLLGWLVVFNPVPTDSLELNVLNDLHEMANAKKIQLKVSFSPTDKLVYREMLRFSSSNPAIVLRYWKASAPATSEYVAAFHQPKKVFAESFVLELTFDVSEHEQVDVVAQLARTNIAVSFVSLESKQKHNAQTALVNLGEKNIVLPDDQKHLNDNEAKALDVSIEHIIKDVLEEKKQQRNYRQPIVDDEIFYVKRFEDFCAQIARLLETLVDVIEIYFIGIVLLFMVMLALLKFFLQRYSIELWYYPRSFGAFISMLFPIACIGVVHFFGARGFASMLFGLYSLLLGIYLLVTNSIQKNFATKSIDLIGGGLVISSLPLIVKGILILSGL
ncbi:hypothetical protein FJ364_00190 [Candidatus Dependentiae bacterium]|nr:hypothetical protein [Candidatus Dependentiae bacterium]